MSAKDNSVSLSVKIQKGRFTTNPADGNLFIRGKKCNLPEDSLPKNTIASLISALEPLSTPLCLMSFLDCENGMNSSQTSRFGILWLVLQYVERSQDATTQAAAVQMFAFFPTPIICWH